jgi:hypothetical protein
MAHYSVVERNIMLNIHHAPLGLFVQGVECYITCILFDATDNLLLRSCVKVVTGAA